LRNEFVSKLGVVEEEADETCYWLELLEALGIGEEPERARLHREATELLRIVVAAKKRARRPS
jgi:four helix bundle protein